MGGILQLAAIGVSLTATIVPAHAQDLALDPKHDVFGQPVDACFDGYIEVEQLMSNGELQIAVMPCAADEQSARSPVYGTTTPACPINPPIEADNRWRARYYASIEISEDRTRIRAHVPHPEGMQFVVSTLRTPASYKSCK